MPPVPGYTPGGYAAPPPPRGNGAAVASLVLGILGCIPLITGLLAILFGIIGLRRAKQPYTGGSGMAVAGLTLGIISVLSWGTCWGLSRVLFVHSGSAGGVARQYMQDLAANNLAAARANAAAQVTTPQIQAHRDQIAPWGGLNDVRFTGIHFHTVNGATQWRLTGIATFTSGPHPFEADLVQQNGQWKVERLQFQ
jgi:hypothetical protein